MKPSKLDIDKFNKVRTLMERGSMEGERSGARSAAERLARSAGMTLEAAIKLAEQLDDPTRGQAPRASDPAAEAAKAAQAENAMREALRRKDEDAHFADGERRFGPSDDAFAETRAERALRIALASVADFKSFGNSPGKYLAGFAGWTGGPPPASLLKLLNEAIAMPVSIVDAWKELMEWRRLFEKRAAYHLDHEPEAYVYCRTEALASILDTMPVRGWEDFDTRMKWRLQEVEGGMAASYEENLAAHERLKKDSEILRNLRTSKMDSPTTNASVGIMNTVAKRREAVVALLNDRPELSDRAIARRCGVSPQTVNNHRHGRTAQPDKATSLAR